MAADSALGFLAQLAAMKAGGASTAYAGGDSSSEDEEPKKKKKKKKKKTKKNKDSKASKNVRGSKTKKVEQSSKLSKKGKGKKGKKRKSVAPPIAITDEIEEFEEKTPEPPPNLSEIEKRKFRLKYARRKLEKRKKEREQIRLQKAAKLSQTNNSNLANDGRSLILEFMKQLQSEQCLIESRIREALRFEEEAEEKQKAENDLLSGLGLSRNPQSSKHASDNYKSLDRKAGRINVLSICDEMNHALLIEKRIITSDKQCMTDALMFEEYLREEFLDDFMDEEGNPQAMKLEVIAGLIESSLIFGYPRELWQIESGNAAASPSPFANKIRLRERAENERKHKIKVEKERRRLLREEEKKKRKNVPHLSRRDANLLIKRGDFLLNFEKKTKWIERTLGINMEYMESVRDEEDEYLFDDEDDDDESEVLDDDDDNNDVEDEINIKQSKKPKLKSRDSVMIKNYQQKQRRLRKKMPRNYLKFRKRFSNSSFDGRAIGNIDFSEANRDWFAASYFASRSKYSTDNHGCIGIWNFLLPTYPEYTLFAQNMIASTHFHPTDPFLVFGSTMNGQILMWDLRSNKAKPIERSNFSNGHSSPVFTMSFLPNIKEKQAESARQRGKFKQNKVKLHHEEHHHDVQHILSVSNDGKLCIWRTDQLSVKPLNQATLKPSDEQSTARQIELITTCFDYSYRDYTQVVLGSDEGYLYKAEIFTQNSSNDDSLSIKESIAAHYGPITSVQFFPIHRYNKNYNFAENVSGLYLTSSYDWTVKLWHDKLNENRAISIFDQMSDYVYDVKWNIGGKPGVFACCDAQGQINIFDLAQDFRHPIVTKEPIKITNKKNVAATTIQWTYDGKFLACGDSDGNVSFFNVHQSIARQTLESCEALQSVANKYIV